MSVNWGRGKHESNLAPVLERAPVSEPSGDGFLRRKLGARFRQSIRELSELRQLLCDFRLQRPRGLQPPSPVSSIEARSIHTRVAAQAQHILQRHNAQTGNRTLGCSNE